MPAQRRQRRGKGGGPLSAKKTTPPRSYTRDDAHLLADVPKRISACASIEALIVTCRAVIDAARRDLKRSPRYKVWPHYSHEEIAKAVAIEEEQRRMKKKEKKNDTITTKKKKA